MRRSPSTITIRVRRHVHHHAVQRLGPGAHVRECTWSVRPCRGAWRSAFSRHDAYPQDPQFSSSSGAYLPTCCSTPRICSSVNSVSSTLRSQYSRAQVRPLGAVGKRLLPAGRRIPLHPLPGNGHAHPVLQYRAVDAPARARHQLDHRHLQPAHPDAVEDVAAHAHARAGQHLRRHEVRFKLRRRRAIRLPAGTALPADTRRQLALPAAGSAGRTAAGRESPAPLRQPPLQLVVGQRGIHRACQLPRRSLRPSWQCTARQRRQRRLVRRPASDTGRARSSARRPAQGDRSGPGSTCSTRLTTTGHDEAIMGHCRGCVSVQAPMLRARSSPRRRPSRRLPQSPSPRSAAATGSNENRLLSPSPPKYAATEGRDAGHHGPALGQRRLDSRHVVAHDLGLLRAGAHALAALDAQFGRHLGLSARHPHGLDRAGAHAAVAVPAPRRIGADHGDGEPAGPRPAGSRSVLQTRHHLMLERSDGICRIDAAVHFVADPDRHAHGTLIHAERAGQLDAGVQVAFLDQPSNVSASPSEPRT